MARLSTFACLAFLLVFLPDGALTNEGSHWSYSGDGDPDHWANLNHDYTACGGKMQSPINIDTMDVEYKDLSPFTMSGYNAVDGTMTLKNNGHSAQVDTTDAMCTVSGGSLSDTYKLLQFHFHWGQTSKTGSEHTINKKRYPLEMHMVHMSTKYNDIPEAIVNSDSLTVITTMFEVGSSDNPAFVELTNRLRNVTHSGENITLTALNISSLMPTNLADYYTYNGSLTTPPCSEVVVWNIFHETVKISEEQLTHFRALMNYPKDEEAHGGGNGQLVDNFRPVKELNGRVVYSSSVEGHIPSGEGHMHWGYAHDGTSKWANDDNSCNGKYQSPINIEVSDAKYDPSLGAFTMVGYNKVQGQLILNNNGHSAQVNTNEATWTVTGGSLSDTYKLQQFHFHWGKDSTTGSEHTINSKKYPLEMHMVHSSDSYNESYPVNRSLTVLAIMFEVADADNSPIQELTKKLSQVVYSDKNVSLVTLNIRKLMPDNISEYYTYDGSLTTPPCSEIVVWNVFRQTVKISEKQLNVFRALRTFSEKDKKTRGMGLMKGFMYDNYRPVKMLNGRTVRKNFKEQVDTPNNNDADGSVSLFVPSLTVLLASLLVSKAYLL